MYYLKFLILIGQLGKVWAKKKLARQIFSSITAIGFFSLFFRTKDPNDQTKQNRPL